MSQMNNRNAVTDNLIFDFTENYMGKLFYFCLKKTGDSREAEDLASDIVLNVFASLRKGTVPDCFYAWVWKIARNRYSIWAAGRHKRNESVSGADINEFEIADDASAESEFLHNEELSLLRRELAFISSDYREIVTAYYIDDTSVKDIAVSLGLPEGTVKSKLFRARNILKAGMSMAREFGVMSYKPENVGFIMNGMTGKSGEPLSLIRRNLCKNIMLAAYRTPSAAEELAVELGVALPYMEDELNELTQATLLKKNGNKYETNIFIASAKAQEKIFTGLLKIVLGLAAAIIAVQEYTVKCLEENGSQWHEGYQPYEDMKWALLMQTVDRVNFGVLDQYNSSRTVFSVANLGKWGHTIRPDGGEWDLLGLEDYQGPRPAFVGLHGCIDTPEYMDSIIDFGQFKFMYKGINSKTPVHLSFEEGKALVAAAKKNISDIPSAVLEKLVEYGYLKKNENCYVPAFCVMFREKIKTRTSEQEEEYKRLFNSAVKIGFEHYMFCRDIICNEIPDFLKDDRYQIDHACANIYEMRGAVLEEALRTGYISYTDNDDSRMLGAYLII